LSRAGLADTNRHDVWRVPLLNLVELGFTKVCVALACAPRHRLTAVTEVNFPHSFLQGCHDLSNRSLQFSKSTEGIIRERMTARAMRCAYDTVSFQGASRVPTCPHLPGAELTSCAASRETLRGARRRSVWVGLGFQGTGASQGCPVDTSNTGTGRCPLSSDVNKCGSLFWNHQQSRRVRG